MKKLLLFIFAFLCMQSYAQEFIDENGIKWTVETQDSIVTFDKYTCRAEFNDVAVTITPSSLAYGSVTVCIANHSGEDVTIKWKGAKLNGTRLIDSNTPRALAYKGMEDEEIYDDDVITRFLIKENGFKECFSSDDGMICPKDIVKLFKKKKVAQKASCSINIPILIGGKTKVHSFTFNISYSK